MRFKGKVALVTGGNSGIGRGIVHRFVEEGARVAFVGRDEAKGRQVESEVAQMGGTSTFCRCDLSSEEAVKNMIGKVAELGRLDIVVNNAGIGVRRSQVERADTPGKRWDKYRGSNIDAAYFVSSYALPLLKQSGGGAIVNISSTATLHGNWGLYCVVKAAVEALTRSLAVEGAPFGIRANCVSPGWIATERDTADPPAGNAGGEWEIPPGVLNRMGSPAEIAAVVAFLASSDASFMTGQTLLVDGGLTLLDYTSLAMLKERGAKLFSGTV